MAKLTGRQCHTELKALADPARAEGVARFFKTGAGEYGEGDRFLGIRVPVLRGLSRKYQALQLSDLAAMLSSAWHEERLLSLLILVRQYPKTDSAGQRAIFDLYLSDRARVDNWDLVDSSAEYIVGAYLRDRSRTRLSRLAKSKNIWQRRIAILATFHYIKRDEFDETLRIATILLRDPHDLIHKAVGWMLREVGNRDRATEEAFLEEHAGAMPRTMLRYAVEKFPKGLRQRYMAMRFSPVRHRR